VFISDNATPRHFVPGTTLPRHGAGRRRRSRARRAALVATLVAVALTVAACGGDDNGGGGGGAGGGEGGGKTLTIYSSLPLQGAARAQAVAAVNGAKLALKEAGGRAGDFSVKYTSLDDSTAQAGGWEPGQTASNARKAISDDSTIGYIGEFNSGATAVSLPLLNEASIAQVSPGNTAVGITSDDPGASPGEPDKYYPTGQRTYARVLPKDTYQGAALAQLAKEQGCGSAYVLNDKEVYGAGLARNVELSAKNAGLEIKGDEGIDKHAANYRSLGAKIKGTGAQCFIYCGITANNAVQLFKDMAVALPEGALLGPEGVGESGFFDPKEGGVPADVARRVVITIPGVAPEEYPPAGKEFLKAYEAEYGETNPDRYAVYGYESMSLLLDAIKRAGANGADRTAVVKQLLATKDREGVFGKYSIDENGDITLTPYGAYRIKDGKLVFDHTVQPQT
jgi:branched-chain amino acid transport system substrate-binding protein